METKFSQEYISRDKSLFTKYLDTYVNKFNAKIGYGTAGFRIAAQYLEHVLINITFTEVVRLPSDQEFSLHTWLDSSRVMLLVIKSQRRKLIIFRCSNYCLTQPSTR